MALFLSCILGILLCYHSALAAVVKTSVKNVTTLDDAGTWVNNWDGTINFKCPEGHMIYRLKSIHHNHYEDRKWQFGCRSIHARSSCQWTGIINDYDKPIDFMCPDDGFLAGMASKHSNHHEDRKWNFYCCVEEGMPYYNGCYETPYINAWDGVMDYKLPQWEFLAGLYSVHSNSREDRRWKVITCD